MFFKLEKKAKKKENTWKIKKQNFKTEKNRKQNKWAKNGKAKREKKGKTWTCPFAFFLHLFCFFDLLFFCFLFAFFCFLPGKKPKKSKKEATKKQNKSKKKQIEKAK